MSHALLATTSAARHSLQQNDCICPVCGLAEGFDFFEARRLPVHVGIFGATRQDAEALPTGDVVLSYCAHCGFVHNRLFDPDKRAYQPGYEVALHHSPTFRKFMDGVAARLMARFSLQDQRILEIGCGCAYFLRMLAELGGNDCIGYDPTVPCEGTERVGSGSVTLVRDYFGPQYSVDADFICCLSVFEHVPGPGQFLRALRQQIGNASPGIYFEVFNAYQAIAQRETWSIHYEQVNYFSRESLAYAFEQAGFRVLEASTCYEGGQYVFVDAVPGEAVTDAPSDQPMPTKEIPRQIVEFAEHHRQRMAFWRARFEEYRQTKRRVVVWGSGGKGITFLNSLPSRDVIPYVVEINPDKHGKFIPGSGQQIHPPEFLASYRPETVIITNALYKPEMMQQAKEFGVECEFLVA